MNNSLASPSRPSLAATLVTGLAAGFVASQALDLLSIGLYEWEGRRWPEARVREDGSRDQIHAYEKGVDLLARATGRHLSRPALARWGYVFHAAFGLGGGVLYALLRRRNPRIAAGGGLGFGALFYALMDELIVPLSRMTPGPRHFPWQAHARGLATHLAYGLAAEQTLRLTERMPRAMGVYRFDHRSSPEWIDRRAA